jgi:hypothetical protein
MRYGRILAPWDFYDRLVEVIGPERVLLSEQMTRTTPDAKSARIGLFVRNPRWNGAAKVVDGRLAKIRELRTAGEYELVKYKVRRKLGQVAEAKKALDLAGQMADEAMRLQAELGAEELAEPELLRVGTLQWPLGTEWMIMTFTQYGAVYAAKFLGWRTALLTMIRSKAITEAEAHKAFPVGSGPAAAWYLEQLKMIRDQEEIVQ